VPSAGVALLGNTSLNHVAMIVTLILQTVHAQMAQSQLTPVLELVMPTTQPALLHLALFPTAKTPVVGLQLTNNVTSATEGTTLTLLNSALLVVVVLQETTSHGLVRVIRTQFVRLVILRLVVLAVLDTLWISMDNVFLNCVCSMDVVLQTWMLFARNITRTHTSVCVLLKKSLMLLLEEHLSLVVLLPEDVVVTQQQKSLLK